MAEEDRTYITPDIDKRQHRRAKLVTEVKCEALNREQLMVTRDVSIGGMYISCNDPLPSDSLLNLSFRLRPKEALISCRGKVVYSLKGMGMGIQFFDLSEESRQALQKFVDEID